MTTCAQHSRSLNTLAAAPSGWETKIPDITVIIRFSSGVRKIKQHNH